jgi:hypothetical protein
MTKSTLPKYVGAIGISIVFVCATIPAFAQRGGGSHGGGFHGGGGGGFHGGGGSSRGGGSGVSAAPRTGGGYSRGVTSAPPRSGGGSYGSYARPSGNSYRSYASPANGNQRVASSSVAPRGNADGQWHSFGSGTGNRGAVAPQSEARTSGSTGGRGQVFGGSRSAGVGQATRSFSGQGRDVWENAPQARNVVPASRALSNIQRSFSNSVAGNSRLRSNALLSTNSGLARSGLGARSAFGTGNLSGLTRSTALAPIRNSLRFGYPFRRFRGGCWNCGFGFGLGLGWWPGWSFGFGWPWLGYSNWGLYWNDPWWGWPGYGYYGYPSNYLYDDNGNYDYGNGPSSYESAPLENNPVDDQSAPDVQSSPDTGAARNSAVPVLLYMKNGLVYSASSYWVADGKLHFIFLSGVESSVDMDQFDLQRTIDVNAKSGVPFTLKPGPNSSEPTPDTNGAPPNPSGTSSPDADPGRPPAPPATTPSPRRTSI